MVKGLDVRAGLHPVNAPSGVLLHNLFNLGMTVLEGIGLADSSIHQITT